MKNKITVSSLNCKNLNNISFQITQASLTTIIGKDNSEILALFKCIADIYDYTGTIQINNSSINNSNKVSLYLGNINLSTKNVFDNLIEPLINIGVDIKLAVKKAYSISKKLGINNLIYKDINSLSYSQKKLISFAKSVIIEPSILLMYDIFSSFDEYHKKKVLEYILYLKSKGSIVLFTTTNIDDLLESDNIIVLVNGKIVSFNETKKVFENEKKIFESNKIKLPFIVDLSYKLMSYGLINKVIYNSEKLVDELWK